MKLPSLCKHVSMTALLIVSVTSAKAQTFPLSSYGPVETTQGIAIARSPSLATDPTHQYPDLYLAVGGTGNDYLYIEWTSDGLTWSGKALGTLNTAYSPSIAFYDGYLWIAYISDGNDGNPAGALSVAYTNDPSFGYTGSPLLISDTGGTTVWANNSPTLAVFNGKLWVAALDSSGNILTAAISGAPPNTTVNYGVNDCVGYGNDPGGYQPEPGAAIGMNEFNNLMFLAYQTTQHTVRVCYTDGAYNSDTYYSVSGVATGGGVSATTYGDALTLAFKDNSSGNHVIVIGSTNPTNAPAWSGEDYSFSMNGSNEINPSGAEFNNNYYLLFSGGSSRLLYTACTSTTCE